MICQRHVVIFQECCKVDYGTHNTLIYLLGAKVIGTRIKDRKAWSVSELALACNFTKSNTSPWVFSLFKIVRMVPNCTTRLNNLSWEFGLLPEILLNKSWSLGYLPFLKYLFKFLTMLTPNMKTVVYVLKKFMQEIEV